MVSDETIKKIAEWLRDFDYSVDGIGSVKPENTVELYIPDAEDLVEKCGLNDESA